MNTIELAKECGVWVASQRQLLISKKGIEAFAEKIRADERRLIGQEFAENMTAGGEHE